MPRRHPKRIGRRLAAKFKALRKWKHSWDISPVKMEAARERNVVEAHKYYRELNDSLKEYVSHWPSSIPSKEFVELLKSTVPMLGKGRTRKGYDWRSFRSRLIRLRLCTFDRDKLMWTNHAKPSVDNVQIM